MDPMDFLHTTNGFKRLVMHAIARRSYELLEIEQANQATLIADRVVRGFSGKS